MARIAFHLRHPVANRLGRRLELLREIVGTTPCAHQLHHSAPVFRRIPCMTLGHRGSPSLSPLRHCPPNRVNSKHSGISLHPKAHITANIFGTATADSSPSEFSLRVFVRCLHRRRKLTSADFSDKERLKVGQLKRTITKRMREKRPAPGSKDGSPSRAFRCSYLGVS